MVSTITVVNIANMALRMLGDDSITSLSDTTRRAQIVNEYWSTTRDATLAEHPWNFATKRAKLFAYELPAATLTPASGATILGQTGVTFTASAAVFAAANVGRQIVNRRTGGTGKATITGFTDTTHVTATIDLAFDSVTVIP